MPFLNPRAPHSRAGEREPELTRLRAEILNQHLEAEDLDASLAVARLAPEILMDHERAKLRELGLALPTSSLAELQANSPWLFSQQEVLVEAIRDGKHWGHVDYLPDYLAPVIEAKAATLTTVMLRQHELVSARE